VVRSAKALGAKTIAEFVETPAQIELLTKLSVDFLQGYALYRPVMIEYLLEHVAKRNPEFPAVAKQSEPPPLDFALI
jgi:EAL domain-containing protein (putative c-di-GMP-specific phosphodiesterase class I)